MGIYDAIDVYFRRWKRFDSYYTRRRLLIIILICIITLYIIPLLFRRLWISSPIIFGSKIQCVDQYVRPFLSDEQKLEANIYKSYEEISDPHSHFLPYVGNGKFGISLSDDGSFNIMGKRTLDIPVPYYPIVQIDYFDAPIESATVVRFRDGIVNKVVCFDYVRKTASVEQSIYAHRLIPSLLIQEIKIINPSDVPLILKLKRKGWTGISDAKPQPIMLPQMTELMDYSMIVGHYDIPELSKSVSIAIAAPDIIETIEVNSHSQKIIAVRTFINYTLPLSVKQLSAKAPELKVSIREVTKKVLEYSLPTLERLHLDAWKSLWSSGFGISYSKAPGSLNGDSINATIYYVLSQRSIYAKDNDFLNLSDIKNIKYNSLLMEPDRCYTGHSTLQASTLWSKLDSLNDVNRITSLWLLTLEKQGCHNLIDAGCEGIMQAMILSMASLQFTNNHLEFNAHPKELHRNYYIRRVNYLNLTMLNITVALDDDNKAQIFVTLDMKIGEKSNFYACDGGCLDSPVTLSDTQQSFPVKQTDPVTAILYITPNKQHIEELKHTIHVKEINEAPAHEHQTIVMHRYGHTLGGLPLMFWVSLVFLIVIFHLFLGKLIYNEYCGGGAVSNVQYERHRQGRYAM